MVPVEPATPQRLKTQVPTVVSQFVMRSGQPAVLVQVYSQVGPAFGSFAQVRPLGQPEVPPSQGVSSAVLRAVVVQAVAKPLLLLEETLPDDVPPVELLELDELLVAAPELVPAAAWQWPLTSQVWPVVQTLAWSVQLAMQVPVGPQTSEVLPELLQAAS